MTLVTNSNADQTPGKDVQDGMECDTNKDQSVISECAANVNTEIHIESKTDNQEFSHDYKN